MKNKISDLRDHMFAALERLSNEDLTPEQLRTEIERSKTVSEVGKVIVESAKTEVLYAKFAGKPNEQPKKFLEIEEAKEVPIVRPTAEYSNKSALGIANG